jgi:spore maturation protein CgeB
MLILYCGMKYDYGKPAQGYSFEHHNFYDALVSMGHDVLYFDFMTLMQERGKSWMNRRLLEVVRSERPGLMFTVLFTDEIEKKAVRTVSDAGETKTLNWFCDDHWRFDSYSRDWAPCFNCVVTTAESARAKYDMLGYTNVIKSQWACNHFQYRRLNLPLIYDVTFVGQPHGTRRAVIESIRQAGIDVRAWGNGWESGRVSQEDMIRIFNQSRINLNLSNASVNPADAAPGTGRMIKEAVSRALGSVPGGAVARKAGKGLLAATRRLRPLAGNRENDYQQPVAGAADQIKGRNFEVPGCGGFLLTGRADNLGKYYVPEKEIGLFEDTKDLVGRIRFYLDNEEARRAVAEAGYRRTLQEHTYAHRFSDIFEEMSLPHPSLETVLSGKIGPGRTIEIK